MVLLVISLSREWDLVAVHRSQCTVTVSQNSCNLELVYALGIFGVIPCVLKKYKTNYLITSDHFRTRKTSEGPQKNDETTERIQQSSP